MAHYGKRDAERAAFLRAFRQARAEYEPPEILRCHCGAPATIALTRRGGATAFFCAAHEHEAVI